MATTYRTGYSSWPLWLTLIGGILIIIQGIVLAVLGTAYVTLANVGGVGALVLGIIAIILGLILIGVAYRFPAGHMVYGGLAVIISLIALFLTGGGFIIGSILGIVGGLWAMFVR